MPRPRELRNRAKFDPKRDLVANRPMTLGGYSYEKGQPIKRKGSKHPVNEKALPRLWASYRIEYKEDFKPIATADPVDEAATDETAAATDTTEAETSDTAAQESEAAATDAQDEDPAPEPQAEKKPAKKKGKAKKAD